MIIKSPEIHNKAWGRELWIHNDEKYCGKILEFNKDAKFSMHFHLKKTETWYVAKGSFTLLYINTDNAAKDFKILSQGDVIHILPGQPHQLVALDDSSIFEISTQHFEDDSYRIEPGDSQF